MLIITSDNFSQYYREHIQTVYRIALGIIRIPEEAEDIAADCFTAMINKAEFNDENHLKAWLIVTAGTQGAERGEVRANAKEQCRWIRSRALGDAVRARTGAP